METVLAVSCQTLEADPVNISTEQRNDTYCQAIRDFWEMKAGTKKQQEQIRNRYVVFEDVLYKKECKLTEQRYILCLPKSQHSKVLQEYHAGKFGGHMGIRRTF